MRRVIDLQEWRRRHPADATKATELSPAWQASQLFWAEPILLSSLTVWRAAAVMWAGLLLTAASEVGFPAAGQRAPAPPRAAALAPSGGRP
jgi:hypothetical protein